MVTLAGTDPALTAFGYAVVGILLAWPAWGALRLIVDRYRQRLADRDPVREFQRRTDDLGRACGWER